MKSAGKTTSALKPALVGKAGEMLVAAELLRRGVEIAQPASDVGVDFLAYRLTEGHAVPTRTVPIQVKAYSKSGYAFHRRWFERAPGIVLVSVWWVPKTPEFYIFRSIEDVEEALGRHAATNSWKEGGSWSSTTTVPGSEDRELMQPHRDQWCRITDQLEAAAS